jgi:DNA repair exonuclease SbcCD ATPase subunit
MMEFKLLSPAENGFLSAIKFNREEIKKELSERLERYRGLTYTDEAIGAAKADRAALRAFKDAIEAKRKEIKKRCLEPYAAFEAQVKEITALIDEPIDEIDRRVKEYEEKLREEKRAKIEEYYTSSLSEQMRGVLPLKKIWTDRWLNATYKMKDIQKEITDASARIIGDLATLDASQAPYLAEMKAKYLETLDLGAALREGARLKEAAERLAEYEAAQAELAAYDAERPQEAPAPVAQDVKAAFVAQVRGPADPPQGQNVEIVDFRVWVTRDQKQKLHNFLKSNGIRFGKVPQEGVVGNVR